MSLDLATENKLGLNGFAFVEFTSPDPATMRRDLERLGFTAYAQRGDGATLFRQGNIVVITNQAPAGHAAQFRAAHGPSANGMAFVVGNAASAYAQAIENGAQAADAGQSLLGEGAHVLQGIGGALLYLVEPGFLQREFSPERGFAPIAGAEAAERQNSVGLMMLDHLTHNLMRGHMRDWSKFYGEIFGFEEQKFFDIKGRATGLFSQAMIAPDRAIRIPLNESQDENSQIEEFIRAYGGEGIQHLAFTTANIYGTVEKLRARGVILQDTPETYYELLDARVPGHGEDVQRLRQNRILLDGHAGEEGLLLQIFTDTMFGPIFFEIIQRKGNQGFGNGNFQALFESIELDQIRRGVVTVDEQKAAAE